MHPSQSTYQAQELYRLWRSYSDCTARALDLMCIRGTDGDALIEVIVELKKAGNAISRIRQIQADESPDAEESLS